MKITIKSTLISIAGVLGIIAFAMVFLSPLKTVVSNGPLTIILEHDWKSIYFGILDGKAGNPHTIIPFIGYCLMLIGGLSLFALSFGITFSKKDTNKFTLIFGFISIVLIIIGFILVLFTKGAYINAINSNENINIDDSSFYRLNTGVIAGGVLGVASAVTGCVGIVVKRSDISEEDKD